MPASIIDTRMRWSEFNAWLASWSELAEDAADARPRGRLEPHADRVVVLIGLDTNGLEIDGIVVVSPQEIKDESSTGRSTLDAVLTRGTQPLATVS